MGGNLQHDDLNFLVYLLFCQSVTHFNSLNLHADNQHKLWENKSIDVSIYSYVDQFIIEHYFCLMKLPGDNLILVGACCCVIWSVSNTNSSKILIYNTNTTDG